MRRDNSRAFLRSSTASVLISNTPKIEHITFSVNLLRDAFYVCLIKKMPQSGRGRKRIAGQKIKNAMVIVDW
ncbi:hypothetical protein AM349_24035 [Citrobacter freundii]|nr:hypothetical protein CFA70_08845 [Citrobacter freundii]AVH81965.1 hypothetical protein AL515_22645 [Citrobacter sp. FDAARGOS_156]POU46532.1 hypothetical protein C3375_06655 [Citrobacter freundii complex sp. CFNIH12]POV67693.1 hypothetical protein C3404_02270 [Citrobacter freundii complex sp. CFNIH11]PSF24143.1 hypothetical protein C6985_03735 [Escherichia coli]